MRKIFADHYEKLAKEFWSAYHPVMFDIEHDCTITSKQHTIELVRIARRFDNYARAVNQPTMRSK